MFMRIQPLDHLEASLILFFVIQNQTCINRCASSIIGMAVFFSNLFRSILYSLPKVTNLCMLILAGFDIVHFFHTLLLAQGFSYSVCFFSHTSLTMAMRILSKIILIPWEDYDSLHCFDR